jgi:hypothetical protein
LTLLVLLAALLLATLLLLLARLLLAAALLLTALLLLARFLVRILIHGSFFSNIGSKRHFDHSRPMARVNPLRLHSFPLLRSTLKQYVREP